MQVIADAKRALVSIRFYREREPHMTYWVVDGVVYLFQSAFIANVSLTYPRCANLAGRCFVSIRFYREREPHKERK
jgi:hypothetical protein